MRNQEIRVLARSISLFVSFSALFSAGAGATTMLFADRTSFELATGATSPGSIPQTPSGVPFPVGILTFSNASGSSVNASINWSTLIGENFDLAINGVENFNVASSSPLFSFGFDFHEPSTASPSFPDTCNATCFESTFRITLLDGLIPVGFEEFSKPNDALTFVGVWSSDPFDRIEIRETTGNIDNEFFGNFLTGNRPLPEPTTLTLLGVGLVGLVLRRRGAA